MFPAMPLPLGDGPALRIIGDQIELSVIMDSPTIEEAGAFRRTARFAWIGAEHTGILAFKLGAMDWQDCPFYPHLQIQKTGDAPNLTRGKAHLVHMNLIDGDTGLLLRMRSLTWPAQFVDAVAASIEQMLAKPASLAAHNAAVDALYARYPDSEDLVRRRADVTCIGGENMQFAEGTGPDRSPR